MTSPAATKSRAAILGVVIAVVGLVAVINIQRTHGHRVAAPPTALSVSPAPSTIPSPKPVTIFSRCGSAVGGYFTEDFGFTIGSFAIRPVRAVASRCSDGTGVRQPSLVTVVDSDDNARVIATLIPTTQNVHVYALSVTGLTVSVTFTAWAAGQDQGAMYRQSFTSTDETNYRPGLRTLLYQPCTATQLRLTEVPGTAADAVVLRVQNSAATSCVLEGYPAIEPSAVVAGQSLPDARPELVGHSGGVSTATAPPIVALAAGRTASAAVDSATGAPDGGAVLCGSITALAVGLAEGKPLGTVAAAIRICDFQVHPWVAGLTGSD